MGLLRTITIGAKKVRKAVKKQQVAYDRRGVRRRKAEAATWDRQQAKADAELLRLSKQRQVYETYLEVKKQKDLAKRARIAAGKQTVGERAVQVLRGTGVVSGGFYRGFVAGTPTRSTRRR